MRYILLRKWTFALVLLALHPLAQLMAWGQSASSVQHINLCGVDILVDASDDGGVWWFPQGGAGDPSAPHQGKALADYMRSLGGDVRELPRPFRTSLYLLNQYPLVLLVGACNVRDSFEIPAYKEYVLRGGRLILIGEHPCTLMSPLPRVFGLQMSGSHWGTVVDFTPHPITIGVTSLQYHAGSSIAKAPPGATTLGSLHGEPVMGIMPLGSGEVFYIGDVHALEAVSQPFVDNLICHLVKSAGYPEACNRPPDCSAAEATPRVLWPPNHGLSSVDIVGVTDPDGDPVTIQATGVVQDEPADDTGDGSTSQDAMLLDGQVLVRSEREGHGNGRVYRISFTAEDPYGLSCAGTVSVCVPHERHGNCVDDGLSFRSLAP
jgi:hypothetical protein